MTYVAFFTSKATHAEFCFQAYGEVLFKEALERKIYEPQLCLRVCLTTYSVHRTWLTPCAWFRFDPFKPPSPAAPAVQHSAGVSRMLRS